MAKKRTYEELEQRVKELEEEAVQREQFDEADFYQAILDGIHNGVWVTDEDDVIYYTNKGMEIIAGILKQQIDPLVCPRCHGQMRVISFIEQPEIIEKILKHLDLWETRNHDPATRKATHIPELIIDPSYLPCSIKRNVSSILLFESAVKGKYHMTFDPSI